MNESINLREILKDTPKGTLLYSPLTGEVEFDQINILDKLPIHVRDKKGHKYNFTQQGTYFPSMGECLLFPSKDQRDWSKYQRPFKDGDILTTKLGSIFIYHYSKLEEMSNKSICCAHIAINPTDKTILNNDEFSTYMSMCSFATEEEKQKLFQAIKDNGYEWNAETKTLEKLITPKFKVGDIIQDKDSYKVKITNVDIEDRFYTYKSLIAKGIGTITFKDQDDWELVSNKFDISTLKPFDKVLVRDNQHDYWVATLFSHIGDSEHYPYVTTYINTRYCIPYNIETEHLVGTTLEEPEFYKI